jgi:hypothetical protein
VIANLREFRCGATFLKSSGFAVAAVLTIICGTAIADIKQMFSVPTSDVFFNLEFKSVACKKKMSNQIKGFQSPYCALLEYYSQQNRCTKISYVFLHERPDLAHDQKDY